MAGAAEQNDRVTFGAGEIPAGADPLVQGSRDKMVAGEGDTTRPQRAQQASFIGIDSAMSPFAASVDLFHWISSFSPCRKSGWHFASKRVLEQEADQRFGAGRQSCLIEDDFALLPRRLDREFIFDANPEPRPSVFPASLKGRCA